MGGRLALVIGSECTALGELGFTGALAGELYARLREVGGWRPATGVDGPVLDPTMGELVTAVDEAFAAASRQEATLLIAFIGHGTATGDGDFYLHATDSPRMPRSQNAFHLAQTIREQLNSAVLDGLVVLIDACESGQGVLGAAKRWTDMLALSSGRMELLVASGDGPAYAGCFTRTMLDTFDGGLALRGSNLLPSDLVDPIARRCIRQRPQHLSFTAGMTAWIPGGDPGLWLVPNVARRQEAVVAGPLAGYLDQLTNGVLVTDAMREHIALIIESGSYRLRGVIGAAGCGKSTLMAMLVRPSVVGGLPVVPDYITAHYITAALFLTGSSTFESATAELSGQLSARVPGFADAVRAARAQVGAADSAADAFDIEVRMPLAASARAGSRITIIVDGLDQPAAGIRRLLVVAVGALTRHDDLRHVRVIATMRAGCGVDNEPELAHMYRIELGEPAVLTDADIARLALANNAAHLTQPLGAEDGWYAGQPGSSRPEPGWSGPQTQQPWGPPSTGENRDIDWLGDDDEDDWQLTGPPEQNRPRTDGYDWLTARLAIDGGASPTAARMGFDLDSLVDDRFITEEVIKISTGKHYGIAVLAVLTAAGVGPVLPLTLTASALAFLGHELPTPRIRDILARLRTLVTRADPGTEHESVGLTSSALLPILAERCTIYNFHQPQVHQAIIAAIAAVDSAEVADYARASAARHFLGCGDIASAVNYLRGLETSRAADNRDLWSAWLPSITAVAGERHPDALTARAYLLSALADSGDIARAVAGGEQLLRDLREVRGVVHPETERLRDDLVRWGAQASG